MKKFTSILLVLLVLSFSLAAVAAAEEEQFFPYDTPVEVTVLAETNPIASYDSADPTRASAQQNSIIDSYKLFLNVDVSRRLAEDEIALNAVLNTGIAGGSLPDVMIVPADMFYVLAENGVLQDLSAAYEESKNYPYLTEILDLAPDMMAKGMIDGELLGIPEIPASYSNTQVLWVRQDWLDKVGMEAPTTIDEMIEVARAFKEAQLGGEDTIPIGMTNSDLANNWHFHDYRGILAAYGAVFDTWMEQDDGTYIYGNTCDAMKDGLLALQAMYAEGLFKSDFAVTNIIDEEVANSRVGMFYATGWHAVTCIKANYINDPDAVWTAVAIPTIDGEPVDQYTNGAVEHYFVVSADYAYPEVVFKMLNLEMKLYYGPSDEESLVYHTCADGYQMWNNRVLRNFSRIDKDMYFSSLINAALAEGKTVDEVGPDIRNWYDQVLKGIAGEREFIGRYLCQTQAYPIVAEMLSQGLLHMAYDGPTSDTMQLYSDTINVELNNAIVKVIMGEDISTFEDAVDAWYANGGQTITDEVNAYYQAMD